MHSKFNQCAAQEVKWNGVRLPRKRAFDPIKYKLRNRIEPTIGRRKQLRRIASRYDDIP